MKKILSVTDFSDAAINAGLYALRLSESLNANLSLLHVFKPHPEIPESYLLYEQKQHSGHWLDKVKEEARKINRRGKIKTECLVATGYASDTILAEAKRNNCDMIVCGMKGSGKFFRKIFGSTTTKLAVKTLVPLLIIPEEARFQKPGKILLAVDMNREPFPDQLDVLQQLGTQFNAQLSILTITAEEDQNTPRLRLQFSGFAKKLKELRPSFTVRTGINIPHALGKFIAEDKPDMLVLLGHHHRFTEKIFAQNVTRSMSFLTGIPLLLLPEKNPAPLQKLSIGEGNKTLL